MRGHEPSLPYPSVCRSAAINERRIYGCIGSTALTGANRRGGRVAWWKALSAETHFPRATARHFSRFVCPEIDLSAGARDRISNARLVSHPLFRFIGRPLDLASLQLPSPSFRDFKAFHSD